MKLAKTEGEGGVEYGFSGVQFPKLSRKWKLFFLKQRSLEKEKKIKGSIIDLVDKGNRP